MEKGVVYWITGLSGAGKTTIGTMLFEYLKKRKDNVVFLDGDILRTVYILGGGYSTEERKKMAYQDCRMCRMLSDQNIDVVYCGIAMYEECRQWNRENIEKYKVIYLSVPMDILLRRDKKHLYSRALRGEISEVVGVDLPYDEPLNPEALVDNSGKYTPDEVLGYIVRKLGIN